MKNWIVKNKKILIEGIVALIVICVFILATTYMIRSCSQVCDRARQQGLKNIVSEAWEGNITLHDVEMVDFQLHIIQRGIQEALITISDNGTIWIDPALSREDIVKVIFEAGWPDNYELIFGEEK